MSQGSKINGGVFYEMSDARRYRHILKLRDRHGLKFSVIASRIGLSTGRVCQLYQEAKKYIYHP